MEFIKVKHNEHRFWISGIYKIVEFIYYRNKKVFPYYRVYYIRNYATNWGDHVYFQSSLHTFKECVAMADKHAKTHEPAEITTARAKELLDSYTIDED